ncbi:hypothetical protein LTR09_010126 [Extremus antarcticus]|uniref:Peroxisomal membrane protein PEX14 n=1 Tax=Extremus antarcticus TaxID=702011 RepID=A0AAJ0D819_9PEZI|nr:hypothetical protein LTR09_010126 [Extremus antarcticus]
MADDDSNPAIPAWQKAQKPLQQPEETPKDTPKTEESVASEPLEDSIREVEIPTPAGPVGPAAVAAAEEMTSKPNTPTLQLQHMQTFLEDPAVKAAPIEEQRAFFESKGISKEQIDQVLSSAQSPLSINDFETFKQAQTAPAPAVVSPPPQRQQQQPSGPPIITYPEFLVEAHKPPPLITPARILTTAYIASGAAALIYGASKFLVTPMSDSLTDARHKLATHSQSKIDEMNEKLTQLVSKVPDSGTTKPNTSDAEAGDDNESMTSDPTELYHRDMGTQTSPPTSRTSSLSVAGGAGGEKAAPSDHQETVLKILSSHLNEFVERDMKLTTANEYKQDSLGKLRSYLDGIMYTNAAYGNMWSEGGWGDEVGKEKDKKKEKEEDVVEELKKEIRGVKGVLLSAKRFPGVVGRVGA